jgi:hypothetical protein
MTIKDAREFVKIIRKEKYKTNPLQEQFLKSIETGTIHVHNKTLSSKQVDLLKSIYQKATMKG